MCLLKQSLKCAKWEEVRTERGLKREIRCTHPCLHSGISCYETVIPVSWWHAFLGNLSECVTGGCVFIIFCHGVITLSGRVKCQGCFQWLQFTGRQLKASQQASRSQKWVHWYGSVPQIVLLKTKCKVPCWSALRAHALFRTSAH